MGEKKEDSLFIDYIKRIKELIYGHAIHTFLILAILLLYVIDLLDAPWALVSVIIVTGGNSLINLRKDNSLKEVNLNHINSLNKQIDELKKSNLDKAISNTLMLTATLVDVFNSVDSVIPHSLIGLLGNNLERVRCDLLPQLEGKFNERLEDLKLKTLCCPLGDKPKAIELFNEIQETLTTISNEMKMN